MRTTSDNDRRLERERVTRDADSQQDERNEPVMMQATPADDMRTIMINRISWGAVFAGVAVSLVIQLILNMFGVGIGLGTLDPGTGDNPATSSLSIGAAVWWGVSSIIAASVGGYAAGRLSGKPEYSTAAWHGLVSWAFATLAVIYLLGSAVSSIVGGTVTTAANVAGNAASGNAQALRAVLPSAATQAAVPFTVVEQQFRSDAGDQSASRDLAITALRDVVTAQPANVAAARDRATLAVSRVLNLQPDAARQRVTAYEQQYQQATAAARVDAPSAQTADKAARAASWSIIGATIALLLGGLASWWGGGSATVHPTITALAHSLRARGVAFRRIET